MDLQQRTWTEWRSSEAINWSQSALMVHVQRFRVGDGPGIRSTVVLKGCPLRCIWCEKPESRMLRPEVLVNTQSCTDCLRREPTCHEREREHHEAAEVLDAPLAPHELCPRRMLRLVGQFRTVGQVMEILQRDAALYQRSGGGITIGGGEPLYQSEFTLELLRAAKQRGWHTAIDTSGHCSVAVFEEALEHTDLVMFSLKETDLQLHRLYTGVSIEPIIRNLVRAAVSNRELWVRLPVVPLANDRDDHWHQVGNLVGDLPGPPTVHLLPYRGDRPVGPQLPAGPQRANPSSQRLREIADLLGLYGLDVHVH
ncbi:MAG: glycyl-radical enzyme activating protein [Fimbriimonadaceae bacterium]|nr:glycyl-radical enzyme activating protein [Fimbriimonadaceae bacterium]